MKKTDQRETVKNRIETFSKEQKWCTLQRELGDAQILSSSGYILNYSKDFVLLQESDDFRVAGCIIIPMGQIVKVRRNKNDQYYDKIMEWEGEKKNIGQKTKVNLESWKTIFKSFQKKKVNVIVECEHEDIDTFTIGPVKRVTEKSVSVLYFSAVGILDDEPSKLKYDTISKVSFNDRYIEVFSKYIRKNKAK